MPGAGGDCDGAAGGGLVGAWPAQNDFMKTYQQDDPLHGHGKAMPHPKRPTNHTYRGGAFHGFRVEFDRETFRENRRKTLTLEKGRGVVQSFSVLATLCAMLGIRRGARGKRG